MSGLLTALSFRFALPGLVAALAAVTATAQRVVPLLDYTNSWRFNETGNDPGATWMAPAFDDSNWPAGPGPLGFEPSWPYPYPRRVGTPLMLGSPPTPAFFFRTHFQFNAADFAPAQQLVADLFVDDGCVIFLNGTEVGRLRVPIGQTYLTYGGSFLTYEGENEVMAMSNAALVSGDNVLAVEVHQWDSSSSDIFFGMRLRAVAPDPLIITRQPEDATVVAGRTATFTVEVSGRPVIYQWRKDGAALANATNDTLTLVNVQTANGGTYSVIVSNQLGAIESTGAALTLVTSPPDTAGPKMVSAQGVPTGSFNNIDVVFSERLLSDSTRPLSNYLLTPVDSTNAVSVSASLYNPGASGGPPPTVRLRVGGPLWQWGSNYVLTVNRLRDSSPGTNIIAPDSQIAIGYPITKNLISAGQVWHYHASLLDDPDIAEAPWFATNYVEDSWWQTGVGAFYANSDGSACYSNLTTALPFQRHPTLFRTTFQWPTNQGSSATINFNYQINDAIVIYLNGHEVLRDNLPAAPAPLDVNTRALGILTRCATTALTVTNLLPGTNWLAAAAYQASQPQNFSIESNLLFSLSADTVLQIGPSLPELPVPPRLDIAPLPGNKLRLAWTGPGFALESATNFTVGPNAKPGPWTEVPNMANPYTNNSTTDGFKLYRLRK